jgi:2-aminoadipate transaminase
MPIPWQDRFARRAQSAQSSAIRELFKHSQRPEVISFAGGLPAPEVFPVGEMKAACERVLTDHPTAALQYSVTEGFAPLREWVARRMDSRGLRLSADNILITTGSQQSLDLVGKLLLEPGDRVAVENPTFLGALQSFNLLGAGYAPVEVDDDGLRTDLLPAASNSSAKFLYVMPTFQNPCGVTLTPARRTALLDYADRTGLPLVEDDPYSALAYDGEPPAPLFALDAERTGAGDGLPEGNVLYLGSFSKILAPGLRLAWIAAPAPVIAKLVQIKQGADLHTSILVQMMAFETVRNGFLDGHIPHIREVYRERRDAMLAALRACFPPDIEWTRPGGGLFLWVCLPEGMVSVDLLRLALKRDVAFVPGNGFFALDGRAGDRYFRLNFSNMKPELIREGIGRLAAAVKETRTG